MTAGLPVRTLTYSGASDHAPGSRFAPILALAPLLLPLIAGLDRLQGYLDKVQRDSLTSDAATTRPRDAVATSDGLCARNGAMREAPPVQFNFALIYSVLETYAGRSFSGVTS